MDTFERMAATHPLKIDLDMQMLRNCVQECRDCAETCTMCADACLGEDMIDGLRRCIRLNLDCADVCAATARLVARLTMPDMSVAYAQVTACARACLACAEECHKHADMHIHCAVCADACTHCQEVCDTFLRATPATAPSVLMT